MFAPQGIGDINMAYQCFRLSLSAHNDHAEAYNNLGVLEMRKGHVEQVYHCCVIQSGLLSIDFIDAANPFNLACVSHFVSKV